MYVQLSLLRYGCGWNRIPRHSRIELFRFEANILLPSQVCVVISTHKTAYWVSSRTEARVVAYTTPRIFEEFMQYFYVCCIYFIVNFFLSLLRNSAVEITIWQSGHISRINVFHKVLLIEIFNKKNCYGKFFHKFVQSL